MSERYSPPPAAEHYRKRNDLREAHISEGQAYENFRRSIEADPTKANKLRKVGRWLTARSNQRSIRQNAAVELGSRRKNVAEMRLTGLKEAKQDRKYRKEQAKEDLRFAEHGYRRGERRQQLKSERLNSRARLNAESDAAHGSRRGVGARIERFGNRWQARKEAKRAVAGRENEAWVRRHEHRENLQNAKDDLEYTKRVLKKVKADDRRVLTSRSIGTSNKWSDLKRDALASQDDRIAALRARQEANPRYRYLTGADVPAAEAASTPLPEPRTPDMSRVVATAADTVRADIDAVEPTSSARPRTIPTFEESVSDLEAMMNGIDVPTSVPAKHRRPRRTPVAPDNVISFSTAKAKLEANRQAAGAQYRPPTVPTPPPEAV